MSRTRRLRAQRVRQLKRGMTAVFIMDLMDPNGWRPTPQMLEVNGPYQRWWREAEDAVARDARIVGKVKRMWSRGGST